MFVPLGIVHGHDTRHSVNGLSTHHCKLIYGCGIIFLMMFRYAKVLTPLKLALETIFSKVSGYFPANFAKKPFTYTFACLIEFCILVFDLVRFFFVYQYIINDCL